MVKYIQFIGIAFLALLVGSCIPKLQNKAVKYTSTKQLEFKLASYNIRYASSKDEKSGNGWDLRKGPLAKVITSQNLALVGTQEGNDKQLADLQALLPGYDYIKSPYGGKTHDLHNCATFYQKAFFTPLESGTFWLSQTPDEPSLGWDATDRRICLWTKFKEIKTGKEFYFFNTHFFWKFKTAKQESGPLLVSKIDAIAGDAPVLCMGDFNSGENTPQIKAILARLNDAYAITQTPRKGPEATAFHGGVFEGEPNWRIDFIFLSNHFSVLDYAVLTDSYNNGHYPSDHLPVVSTIRFN